MNTVILAELTLHHNIILEKLDHCWVNGICTKNLYRDVILRVCFIYKKKFVNVFADSFFLILLLLFPSFHVRILYEVWSNPFADSFFFIHLLLLPSLHFHILYEVRSNQTLILYFSFTHCFFPYFIFIFHTRFDQTIRWFFFSYSCITFSFASSWYSIWGLVKPFVESFFLIHPMLFFSTSFSYFIRGLMKSYVDSFVFHSPIVFFAASLSYSIQVLIKAFAYLVFLI